MSEKYKLLLGDCRETLRTLPENSIDSVVTDPPYHLTSIVKRFGAENAAPAQFGTDGAFARASKGFMGQTWDGGDVAFQKETWDEVFRVLKPGGYLLSFSGTRTYHRMVCAIEDAGFEIRDMISWVYGSGFPKSHDVSKGIDGKLKNGRSDSLSIKDVNETRPGDATVRPQSQNGHKGFVGSGDIGPSVKRDTPATDEAKQWQGWGTALKPAVEPIVVARKPLIGTVAQNVLKYGTGAINIDGCRVGNEEVSTHSRGSNGAFPKRPGETSAEESGRTQDQREGLDYNERVGRFPANLIHDGSDEVIALFPNTKSGTGAVKKTSSANQNGNRGTAYGAESRPEGTEMVSYGDEGSAARFFYCAKTNKKDRNEGLEDTNGHPTVKPTDLMRYLCRLVTQPGGIVLDPFMGSGSTGKAAMLEEFKFIGCEMSEDYMAIAKARIQFILDSEPSTLKDLF